MGQAASSLTVPAKVPQNRHQALQTCHVCHRYVGLDKGIGLCKECYQDFERTTALWWNATSWEDLVQLSRRFIRGEIRFQPCHCGPLDEESRFLVPGFLRLHDFGIITIGSQPEIDNIFQDASGDWVHLQQRAFLEVLIPSRHPDISMDNLDIMIKQLLDDPDLVVTVCSERYKYHPGHSRQNSQPIPVLGEELSALEKRLHSFRSTAPNGITLLDTTREKSATTRAALKSATFPVQKIDPRLLEPHYGGDVLSMLDDGMVNYTDIVEEVWPVFVTMDAKHWDAGMNLQAILQSCCEEAGMAHCYVEE